MNRMNNNPGRARNGNGGGRGPGGGRGRGGGRGSGVGRGAGMRGGRGRGGGGRAARVLSRDELSLLLLSLVDDEQRHGYELIRKIRSLSGGLYSPSSGMVYPALAELADAGFAAPEDGEGGRKLYAATPAGVAEANARSAEIAAIVERLEALAKEQPSEPAAVGRALSNLEQVLRNAAADGNAETLDAAIDIIDAAARQIERLGR